MGKVPSGEFTMRVRVGGKLEPTIGYGEAVDLCEELGLIRTIRHEGAEYYAMTEKGTNVFLLLNMLSRRND